MNKPRWKGYETFFGDWIEKYVAYKRAIGRRFAIEHRTLRLLDQFARQRRITSLRGIRPDFIDAFLTSRPRKRPRSFNHLLSTVSGFFSWLVGQEYLKESPVKTRPKRNTGKRLPFIFDAAAGRRLLDAALNVRNDSRVPLRGETYHAIFGLLYALGLRVGEACRLKIGDVDIAKRLLIIRESKFYKSRLVPFGPNVEHLLREHIRARQSLGPVAPEAPLFSVQAGQPVSENTLRAVFYELLPHLSLPPTPGVSRPRVHDLRHSFAVRTLLRWYKSGVDPRPRLQWLTTFMGHVSVVSTQTYLTITDEIFREASRRFEAFAKPYIRQENTNESFPGSNHPFLLRGSSESAEGPATCLGQELPGRTQTLPRFRRRRFQASHDTAIR